MSIKLSPEIGSNFCYAPWTNIHINTEGDYKTCCAGGNVLGKLKSIPIYNILSDKKLLEIKKAIYNNQYHENCESCVKVEKNSSSSERIWYDSIAHKEIIELDNIADSNLQNLDIRWSNTCNLSCVYCDHYASSQWSTLKKQPVERLDYKNTLDSILDFIDSNKKSLKNISLLGGEPLLQKENERLLDVVSDQVSIYVITNLSVPLETNKIFKKLIEKTNVTWDISFETVEERFEYVRHGSSWDLMLKNINYLREATKDKPGQAIAVTSQYSVYNAMNLSKIYESFIHYNLPFMRWSELHHPKILSVTNLPQKFIEKAIGELEICINNQYPAPFLEQMHSSLKNVNSSTKDCNELIKWHIDQEEKYWPNFKYKFADLWAEYREL
jgi:organic radical activating enzyme